MNPRTAGTGYKGRETRPPTWLPAGAEPPLEGAGKIGGLFFSSLALVLSTCVDPLLIGADEGWQDS
jgi:hypothetical protein